MAKPHFLKELLAHFVIGITLYNFEFKKGARANGCTVTSNNNTGAIAPGAAGVGASNTPGNNNPMALKTEMNKVDVIVDGRSVAGMYQVVHHRYETISTTTAVVPRSATDDPHHHQVSTAFVFN